MPDKDGTILKSKEEATAAVTLGLKDSITDDQAYAIARLVATALGNDTTKGITIIDKKANVLYSGGDSDTSAGLATSQLSYKQKLEEQVKNEVKKTLESSNIFSNIEVGMNLDIDFSKTETAQKITLCLMDRPIQVFWTVSRITSRMQPMVRLRFPELIQTAMILHTLHRMALHQSRQLQITTKSI